MQSWKEAGLQAPSSPHTELVLTPPQVHSTVVPDNAGSDTLEGEQVPPVMLGAAKIHGIAVHERLADVGLQSPVLTSHTDELVLGGSVGVAHAYSHLDAPSPGGKHCLTAREGAAGAVSSLHAKIISVMLLVNMFKTYLYKVYYLW